jgi:hypothetical protein
MTLGYWLKARLEQVFPRAELGPETGAVCYSVSNHRT